MEVEHSVTIQRTPGEVFAVVGNPDRDPEWGSLIVASTALTSEPLGVGSRFRQTATFLGVRVAVEIAITAYEPGRLVCYAGTEPVHIEHWRHLEPTPDGTRLTFHLALDPPSQFQLAAAVLRRAARRQMEADLEALRDALERPATRTG